jgi:outer membrane immunogenic protein
LASLPGWSLRRFRRHQLAGFLNKGSKFKPVSDHNAFLTNVAEELTASAHLGRLAWGEGVTRTSYGIAIAAAALSVMPAVAADLGAFPPPARFYPPPAVARVYNWTGCYLGAQLGGAFADNQFNGQFAAFAFDQNDSTAAMLAGGQVGCDLQFARNWVIGAQVDGAWAHLSASEGLTGSQGLAEQGTLALSGNFTLNANVIATATGRIGYAANFDTIAGLFYLKGGGAFVNSNTSNFNGQTTTTTCAAGAFNPTTGCQAFNSPVNSAFSFNAPSSNQFGWTIGVGTEWVVVDNWSILGEWDYLNFGSHSATFTDANLGSTQVSVKSQINEFKLGINYRFGNPLPGPYPY